MRMHNAHRWAYINNDVSHRVARRNKFAVETSVTNGKKKRKEEKTKERKNVYKTSLGAICRKRNRQKRHYLPLRPGTLERKLHLLAPREFAALRLHRRACTYETRSGIVFPCDRDLTDGYSWSMRIHFRDTFDGRKWCIRLSRIVSRYPLSVVRPHL